MVRADPETKESEGADTERTIRIRMNADGIKRKLATVEYSDCKGGESNSMGGKKEKKKWSEIPL